MSIRSLFEADTTAKKPAVELHSYHKFAAAGYLLGSFTFLGMAMINRHNFAVLTVLLAAAAVIELIMCVKFFAMIKGHTIQQADELARQRRNLELIASENIVSEPVMAAMGSVYAFLQQGSGACFSCFLTAPTARRKNNARAENKTEGIPCKA